MGLLDDRGVARTLIPFPPEKLLLPRLARLMHNKHSNYETCRSLRRCFSDDCIIGLRHHSAALSVQAHAALQWPGDHHR